MAKTIYFVAGEVSADNHGAALMRALRNLNPELRFIGRGGPQMAAVGGDQFVNWIDKSSVLGLWEVIKQYGYFRKQFYATLREIERSDPDAVVLIDYPGFNLRLARALRKQSRKIIYYISPQVWAWNRSRIKQMAAWIDLMLCIFPFEAELYNPSGLRTIFVGHPMIERLRGLKTDAPRDPNLIGLFPGSRLREVRKIFPILIKAAGELVRQKPNLRFEVAAASPELKREIQLLLDRHSPNGGSFEIKVGETSAIMQRAFAGIVASGSATLEAAYFRLPFVLIYKVSWITYLAGRLVVKVKYLGMPNVLADSDVVPEFIQHKARPKQVAAAISRLIDDASARHRMVSQFDAIIDSLGEKGASERAARAIIEELSPEMTTAWLESKQTIWIIGGIAAVLFFAANLPWQLDDYDQAKQAYTSFEMVKEGHWLYQHTPHERVATKPPLIGWISAGIFCVTRSWAVAWRLPSLGAAIALSIVLFRSGNAYGTTGGLIALSAFAFNLLTPRLATLVRTDMPLALAIFGIGFLIWDKLRKRNQWTTRDRLLLFALLTAAMLIKGPIVYAFLLPGIVIFACWARSRHDPSRSDVNHSFWPGWWPWILSLLIFLCWAIGGSIFVPGFYDQVVVREFLGRFGETIHRPQPLLFYLPHLLHKFFPWSVLMIGLLVADLCGRKLDRLNQSSSEGAINPKKLSPETLWLIFWIFGGLIVMSLVPSKRVDRIFPVIPPLCLLLAGQISGRENALRRPRILGIVLLLSILFTCGYVASKVISGFRDHRDALVIFGQTVRQQAELHHWRFEVLKSEDEGLLLYLNKMHFIDPERAIDQWNGENLDAIVVQAKDAPAFMRDLQDAALSQIKSGQRKDELPDGYILITH